MQSDSIRNLVLVLGDQLDPGSSALKDIDSNLDAVWMAEVAEENTHKDDDRNLSPCRNDDVEVK